MAVPEAIEPYGRDELDAVTVRYTPKTADLVPGMGRRRALSARRAGRGSWRSGTPTRGLANVEVRRAARPRDRSGRARGARAINFVVARGGIVPPALQGHTPDIVPRFDPDRPGSTSRERAVRDDLAGLELAGTSPGSRTWRS